MFDVEDYVYVTHATDGLTGVGYSVYDMGHVIRATPSAVVVELADGSQHTVCNLNVEKV